jgi:hypothetical protein
MITLGLALIVGVAIGASATHHPKGGSMLHRIIAGRRRKLLAITGALALSAGVAFAAWLLTNQNGKAGGKIGHLQNVVITAQPASDGDALLPGGDGNLVAHIDNPNTKTLFVTDVVADPTSTISNSDSVQCDPNVLASHLSANATGLHVAVPSGGANVTLPAALHADDSLPNMCQDTSFQYPVRLTLSTG